MKFPGQYQLDFFFTHSYKKLAENIVPVCLKRHAYLIDVLEIRVFYSLLLDQLVNK